MSSDQPHQQQLREQCSARTLYVRTRQVIQRSDALGGYAIRFYRRIHRDNTRKVAYEIKRLSRCLCTVSTDTTSESDG
jgi:uncharacterized protein YmfQ (DUF2313 family)